MSRDRGGKESENSQLHAEKAADHGHELNVAEAHAFHSTCPEIDGPRAVNKGRADDGSQHRIRQ